MLRLGKKYYPSIQFPDFLFQFDKPSVLFLIQYIGAVKSIQTLIERLFMGSISFNGWTMLLRWCYDENGFLHIQMWFSKYKMWFTRPAASQNFWSKTLLSYCILHLPDFFFQMVHLFLLLFLFFSDAIHLRYSNRLGSSCCFCSSRWVVSFCLNLTLATTCSFSSLPHTHPCWD